MKTKSMLVIVLVSVLALVFAASCFLLIRGISQFSKEEKTLERSVSTLRNYFGRNPFPSAENVEREEQNRTELHARMEDLAEALRDGQIEPIQKTPAQFLRLFSQKRDELKQVAAQMQTSLAPDFAIGFERYAESGSLPAPADVPRLAQQLVIADQICRIIFEAGAADLASLRREEFESAGAPVETGETTRARVSRRRRTEPAGGTTGSTEDRAWTVSPEAGMLKDGALYARMRFGVTFTARQDAILRVMNALAAHEMFAVVSLLQIEKTANDVTPPAAADKGDEAPLAGELSEYPPRSQRLMSGEMLEQPMQVTMEIDVYRFAELTSRKEA